MYNCSAILHSNPRLLSKPDIKESQYYQEIRMAANNLTTYCNPFWNGSLPDPFVLKVRGRYYAYGTEPERYPAAGSKVFPILTSTDLVRWHEVGKGMPALGQEYFSYWAPEVTVYNGQFLLYYA